MAGWLGIVTAVLGGGLVAGVALYALGRRLERQAAALATRAAAQEGARVLEDARQRVALDARAEILKAREEIERDADRRRGDVSRREAAAERRAGELDGRERELERRSVKLGEREGAVAATEREAVGRLERLAGLSADEA